MKIRLGHKPRLIAMAITAHFLYRELGMFPCDILPFTGHPLEKRTAVYHYLGRRTLVERNVPFNKAMHLRMESINTKLAQVQNKS